MDQKMKKIWLEVGLAVALVVGLGFLGAKMGAGHQNKNTKIVKAEAENEAAAREQEEKGGGKSAGDAPKGGTASGASDGGASAQEAIADGQYPIMGMSAHQFRHINGGIRHGFHSFFHAVLLFRQHNLRCLLHYVRGAI